MTDKELFLLLNIRDPSPPPRKMSYLETLTRAFLGERLCTYSDVIEHGLETKRYMVNVYSAAAQDKRPAPPATLN